MNKKQDKDSAVSPVIGVLLMLVVTIIIAAIVSGFAGGIAGTQQKAPQASWDVKTQYGSGATAGKFSSSSFDLIFTHKGGDTINTKNTQLITWLTLPNGSVVKHVQNPNSFPSWNGNSTAEGIGYTRFPYYRDSMLSASQTVKGNYQAGVESPVWFGKVSISTGQSMRVSTSPGVASFLGLVSDDNMILTSESDTARIQAYKDAWNLTAQCIENKTQLEIKMLDIPSQKYILEKTLNMEG